MEAKGVGEKPSMAVGEKDDLRKRGGGLVYDAHRKFWSRRMNGRENGYL